MKPPLQRVSFKDYSVQLMTLNGPSLRIFLLYGKRDATIELKTV